MKFNGRKYSVCHLFNKFLIDFFGIVQAMTKIIFQANKHTVYGSENYQPNSTQPRSHVSDDLAFFVSCSIANIRMIAFALQKKYATVVVLSRIAHT